MYLRRMCILLLGGIFCLLGLLVYIIAQIFYFLVYLMSLLLKVRCWSHQLLLLTCPFLSAFASYILELCFWCINVYYCYISWCLDPFIIVKFLSLSLVTISVLKSILSDINMATPALFDYCLPDIFFHSLIFSPFVSLNLKHVSDRQHIVE